MNLTGCLLLNYFEADTSGFGDVLFVVPGKVQAKESIQLTGLLKAQGRASLDLE